MPRTFQGTGAGCTPQDPKTKSRLLEAGWRNSRLPIDGRVQKARSRQDDSSQAASREAGSEESARGPFEARTHIKGDGIGDGYSAAHPLPFLRAGVAIVCCTNEEPHPARHCCHASSDIITGRRSPAPTMACLYGPRTTGPTSQRESRRQ